MHSLWRWNGLLAAIVTWLPASQAQTIRVIRFLKASPFRWAGNFAENRTSGYRSETYDLNYSVSQNGSEFSQHVHDHSDDTILVLQGRMDLRQGDSRVPTTPGSAPLCRRVRFTGQLPR